ncbi:aminoglycoside phosphotransferase family protein [Streptomyces sp. NPDC059894]|uniref:aminoglycoside phosphotransferase family protein n=1 Tax=unclassified Streptomyces TaxID=2593676 RepID=UPI00364F4FA1
MLLPPEDVDLDVLRQTVTSQYEQAFGKLEFVPLGEDSWAYRLGGLWVSLRRDLRGHVPAAYRVATLLREAGLHYVLAPLTGADGRVVRLVDGWPVVVFPLVHAEQVARARPTADESERITAMIEEVHSVRAPHDLPVEDFTLSFDADLDAATAFARGPEPAGGYPARLHRLLRAHRRELLALRAEARRLGRHCAASFDAQGITHGEPSAANVLRTPEGLMLADWGGATAGPPECDWFHIGRTLGIDVTTRCRDAFLRFYEIRWILSEVAEYSSRFMRQCAGDQEDKAMWGRLLRYLPDDCLTGDAPKAV